MFFVFKAYAIDIDATIFPPAKNFNTVSSLINTFIPNLLIATGIVFLIMLVYAGLQMIAAGQADPEKWQKTQKTLTTAVAGLIIVVIAYWLIGIIQKITGVNITNPPENL